MTTYSVEAPEGDELGIPVTCEEHGESEEFQPGRRKVAFYCELCRYEIEVNLRDADDGRDLGEMC